MGAQVTAIYTYYTRQLLQTLIVTPLTKLINYIKLITQGSYYKLLVAPLTKLITCIKPLPSCIRTSTYTSYCKIHILHEAAITNSYSSPSHKDDNLHQTPSIMHQDIKDECTSYCKIHILHEAAITNSCSPSHKVDNLHQAPSIMHQDIDQGWLHKLPQGKHLGNFGNGNDTFIIHHFFHSINSNCI